MSSERGEDRPVVVVTGASSGIGRAVAQRFIRDGHVVIAASRSGAWHGDPDAAPERTHALDVSDAAAVDALARSVVEEYGGVDVLVTSAGVIESVPVTEATTEHVQRQLDVNLFGTIMCCRSFTDALVARQGRVVTVSSAIAMAPQPGVAVYAAAKGGVEAFTRSLALELAPHGVRVNAVRPSLVRSEIWTRSGMSAEDYESLLARRAAAYPLGRIGEPDDVSAAVAFLVSEDASWITGVVLPVDGGSALIGR